MDYPCARAGAPGRREPLPRPSWRFHPLAADHEAMTSTLVSPGEAGALEPSEAERLAELEAVVDRGRETFLEVGRALVEIHSRRLYRNTHSSWEGYLRDRFDMSLPRGYELVRAAQVADVIVSNGGTPPATEAAARPLTTVLTQEGPEAVAEAWERVEAQHEGDRPP